MSIFIKIDISKPSLIKHFKKKVSIIINVEQKSENYAIEIDHIKDKLSALEKGAVTEAAKDYYGIILHGDGGITGTPRVCIKLKLRCIPSQGCLGPIRIISQDLLDELNNLGLILIEAEQILQYNRRANAVIRVGGMPGYAGLCFDSVRCTGNHIWVMNTCMAELYSFDVGIEGVINPADAVLKLSESNPTLHKRVSRMIEDMKNKGEL